LARLQSAYHQPRRGALPVAVVSGLCLLALVLWGLRDRDAAPAPVPMGPLAPVAPPPPPAWQRHLGAAPIAVAQTRRVLFAKQLLHDTSLPMAEVALASGFGSIRRFNETFRKLFDRPPRMLRRRVGSDAPARDGVTLKLAYRPPYDWPGMLTALAARDASGREWIEAGVWHRRFDLDGLHGQVSVAHLPARNAVAVTIRFPSVRSLPAIVARVRRGFDLGADIATIDGHLARDPKLAPLIAQRPGLRAPGHWEMDEMDEPIGDTAPPAWRPWHAYAEQHLRMARHA